MILCKPIYWFPQSYTTITCHVDSDIWQIFFGEMKKISCATRGIAGTDREEDKSLYRSRENRPKNGMNYDLNCVYDSYSYV